MLGHMGLARPGCACLRKRLAHAPGPLAPGPESAMPRSCRGGAGRNHRAGSRPIAGGGQQTDEEAEENPRIDFLFDFLF